MAYTGQAIEPVGLTFTVAGTSIGKITSLNNTQTAEDIDVTHFGTSVDGTTHLGFKEFMPSRLRDPGEFSGTLFFDPTKAKTVERFSNTTKACVVTFYDETAASICTWSFNGYFKQLNMSASGVGSAITCDFTIKIAGTITVSA